MLTKPEHLAFKVAIVEDDIQNCDTVLRIIRDVLHGEVVSISERGEAFLTWIEACQANNVDLDIDIILLDIALPEMNGFEVLQAIRKIPALDSVKVVALTANLFQDAIEHYRMAGFHSFIGKPLSVAGFGARIQRILDHESVWER
jgi:two-component system chemotaxis sensor kinase CheA